MEFQIFIFRRSGQGLEGNLYELQKNSLCNHLHIKIDI